MVQAIKPLLGMSTIHVGVLAILLPTQLHANAAEQQIGSLDEVPGSRLQLGPTLAVAALGKVNK